MKFKPSLPGPQSKPKGKACSRKVAYENMKHKTTKKVPLLLKIAYPSSKMQQLHPAASRRNEDGISGPGKFLSENRNNDLVCKRLSGYRDMNRSSGRSFNPCTLADNSERSHSNNDACSVGSCSLNSQGQNGFTEHYMEHPYLERDLLFDDAESHHPSKERAEVSVHSMELRAYRCTLQALFVSGPLSWEQEELLTNLRSMLHVSNDEHLKELRNLIPSGASK